MQEVDASDARHLRKYQTAKTHLARRRPQGSTRHAENPADGAVVDRPAERNERLIAPNRPSLASLGEVYVARWRKIIRHFWENAFLARRDTSATRFL
jgi:hypothetical protein